MLRRQSPETVKREGDNPLALLQLYTTPLRYYYYYSCVLLVIYYMYTAE